MADPASRIPVKIVDPTTDANEAAVVVLADALAAPKSLATAAMMMLYNGTNFDRARGDIANGIDVDVTRVTGTVVVDSELPAAAVISADNQSAPSAPSLYSFLMGFDGTNWDRVQVETSGGAIKVAVGAPISPQKNSATSAALAAGASVDLDSTQLTSTKTGKLQQVVVGAGVALKVVLKTVLNNVATAVITFFVPPYQSLVYNTPHKDYITQAESVTAGFDGFRATITNKDTNTAADVYVAYLWDEV